MAAKLKLVIEHFHSPDVPRLANWVPDDLSEVYVLIEMTIGEHGSRKRDIYQTVIATPEALRRRATGGRTVLAERATLVVDAFSWPFIQKHLASIVDKCSAPTLNESVLRLQRYFMWEFEDMVQSD